MAVKEVGDANRRREEPLEGRRGRLTALRALALRGRLWRHRRPSVLVDVTTQVVGFSHTHHTELFVRRKKFYKGYSYHSLVLLVQHILYYLPTELCILPFV